MREFAIGLSEERVGNSPQHERTLCSAWSKEAVGFVSFVSIKHGEEIRSAPC